MDNFEKSLCIFVAYLRAIYIVHQNNHWTCKGYDQHLLFERLYKSAEQSADAAAEKIVGLFGKGIMAQSEQAARINLILSKLSDDDSEAERSLKLENEFLLYAKEVYTAIKSDEMDKMTLGMDDMIMQICNERETAVYLLKQIH